MAFEFLHDLQESRMTRGSNNQKELTYNDCKERAYLILLMLHAMRFYRSHRNNAAMYAKKTVMFRDYRNFRLDSTDLYNLVYFITGDDTALGKLKDPGAASKERKNVLLSVGELNGFLRRVANNDKPNNKDMQALERVERDLKINNSDYKQIRRRIGVLDTDSADQRRTTITRLIFAARAKLADSDVIAQFSAFVALKGLEDTTKTSPEDEASVPDSVDLQDVRYYKLLMPANRLPYVAKFLESAKAGKTIVGTFVKAYLPLLIMLDDIIKAGPAYVEQLKQLHNRAKNARK